MPYITSVEEIGYERGERALFSRQLEQRLGQVPQPLLNRIDRLSLERFEALALAFIQFESIDDLKAWLKQ
jgi:heme oxygenase